MKTWTEQSATVTLNKHQLFGIKTALSERKLRLLADTIESGKDWSPLIDLIDETYSMIETAYQKAE